MLRFPSSRQPAPAAALVATTGDATNGHSVANSGRVVLIVENAGATTRTVTFNIARKVDGLSVTPRTETLAGSAKEITHRPVPAAPLYERIIRSHDVLRVLHADASQELRDVADAVRRAQYRIRPVDVRHHAPAAGRGDGVDDDARTVPHGSTLRRGWPVRIRRALQAPRQE